MDMGLEVLFIEERYGKQAFKVCFLHMLTGLCLRDKSVQFHHHERARSRVAVPSHQSDCRQFIWSGCLQNVITFKVFPTHCPVETHAGTHSQDSLEALSLWKMNVHEFIWMAFRLGSVANLKLWVVMTSLPANNHLTSLSYPVLQ